MAMSVKDFILLAKKKAGICFHAKNLRAYVSTSSLVGWMFLKCHQKAAKWSKMFTVSLQNFMIIFQSSVTIMKLNIRAKYDAGGRTKPPFIRSNARQLSLR